MFHTQIAFASTVALASATTFTSNLKSDPALVLASDPTLYSAYGPVTVTSLTPSASFVAATSPPPPAAGV